MFYFTSEEIDAMPLRVESVLPNGKRFMTYAITANIYIARAAFEVAVEQFGEGNIIRLMDRARVIAEHHPK